MSSVAIRLAAFAVVLATAFGGGYALGTATDDDKPAPAHDTHDTHDTQQGEQP